MSVIGSNILAGSSGQGGAAGYAIDRSLRFNSGDSAYLNRQPSSAGNRTVWTWSGWVKRGALATTSSRQVLFSAYGASNDTDYFEFGFENNTIYATLNSVASQTTAVFRDASAWLHYFVRYNGTNIKWYINGEETHTWAKTGNLAINGAWKHEISRGAATSTRYYDGYLADIHFIDGQALAPSDFGEYDDNNVWQPIEYSGTYVTAKIPGASSPHVYVSSPGGTGTVANVNGSGVFTSNYTPGQAGSIRLEFDTPVSNVTSLTFKGGGYSVNVVFGIKVNGIVTHSGLTTNSSYAVRTETISSTNISSFEIFSADDGWALGELEFNSSAAPGTPSLGTDATGTNSFHLDFSDNSSNSALGFDSSSTGLNQINTGSVASGVTVLSSMNFPNNGANAVHLRDNNTSTSAADGGGLNTSTNMGYDFLIPYKVRKIETIGDSSGSGVTYSSVFNIQYSDDGSTWTTVTGSNTTHPISAGSGQVDQTTIDDNGAHRYWRLYYFSSSTTGGNIWIASLNMFADDIGANNWFPTNLSVAAGAGNDSLVDTPEQRSDQTDTGVGGEVVGNYATLNPLSLKVNGGTLENGNLTVKATGNYYIEGKSTLKVFDFNSYCELTITDGAAATMWGFAIGDSDAWIISGIGTYVVYRESGSIISYPGNVTIGTGSSYTKGDILGMAVDTTNIQFFKNGVSQGTFAHGKSGTYFVIAMNLASNTNAVADINFGQRAFAYTAPSGYKALCTANLSDPTIADGSQYFDTILWTGQGNTNDRTLTTTTSADLVWTKSRSNAYHHALFDTVRGFSENALNSDSTNSEGTASGGYLKSTTDTTITLAATSDNSNAWYNGSSHTYVGWLWDAGSSDTTIAAGGLNSSTYTTGSYVSQITGTVRDASFAWANMFNGNKNSGTAPGVSDNFIWTPTTSIPFTTLAIYAYKDSSPGGIEINGTSVISQIPNHNGIGTNQRTVITGISSPLTSLKSISLANLSNVVIAAVEIDGKLLIDSAQTPPNVPAIASTVRANPSAGFSVVSYTGNGNNTNSATSPAVAIGHGLSSAPSMIIAKDRTSSRNWPVYHVGTGTNSMCELDTTGAAQTTYSWNQTAPSSSVFYVGNNGQTNNNGNAYIAYCFAPVEGYSAFGKFSGNSNTDGPFQYCGFKPRFLLLKGISAARDWIILDTERDTGNVGDSYLHPNSSGAENTYAIADILSNGFKMRYSGGLANNTGEDYIWAAFASHPFKTSRAN